MDAAAGSFRLKNCAPIRAYVCAYNSNDSSLALAAQTEGVHTGKSKKFKCSTNRCKVFIGFSQKSLKKVVNGLLPVGVSSTVIAGYVGAGAGIILTGSLAAGGVAAVGGAAVVVTAVTIAGAEKMNKTCKKIIRRVKNDKTEAASARAGFKASTSSASCSRHRTPTRKCCCWKKGRAARRDKARGSP